MKKNLFQTRSPHHYKEQGSVFFYILLAVALLAALSYAVSRGSRNNISSLNEQQVKLAAQEIIEYGNTLSATVQKLKLRGVGEYALSFENTVTATNYSNANCTTAGCKIFETGGGALSYQAPASNWLDSAYSTSPNAGEIVFTGQARVVNVGTTNTDLIMYVPYITQDICTQINNNLSLGAPALDNFAGTAVFKGAATAYDDGGTPDIGDENTALAGKTAFCARATGGWYYFAAVLLTR